MKPEGNVSSYCNVFCLRPKVNSETKLRKLISPVFERAAIVAKTPDAIERLLCNAK